MSDNKRLILQAIRIHNMIEGNEDKHGKYVVQKGK